MKYLSIIFILLFMLSSVADAKQRLLTRKHALTIAEQTEEVRHLYALNKGRFVNCIEASVQRPCETDWVTCIDDAWVVRFEIGETCKVEHDGRLSVTLLIDAKNGEILSRFPEKEYFDEPRYCMDDADCLCFSEEGGKSECLNFIYGQLDGRGLEGCALCGCEEGLCTLK